MLSEEQSGILPGTHACVLMVRQNAAERSQVATALLKTTVPNKMHYFSSSTVFCHHILVFLSLSFLESKGKTKNLAPLKEPPTRSCRSEHRLWARVRMHARNHKMHATHFLFAIYTVMKLWSTRVSTWQCVLYPNLYALLQDPYLASDDRALTPFVSASIRCVVANTSVFCRF